VDVNRVLLDALDQRRTALRAAGVDLVLALDYEAPAVWADAHQLQQVLLALVTNAEQALAEHPGPRRLQLSTAVVAERVRLTVEDSGPGLAPGVAERAMEPFYTTRAAGEGHGLGWRSRSGSCASTAGNSPWRPPPAVGRRSSSSCPRPTCSSRAIDPGRCAGVRSSMPAPPATAHRPDAVRPRRRPRDRRRGRDRVHRGTRRGGAVSRGVGAARSGERDARARGHRARAPRRPRRRHPAHRRVRVRLDAAAG
jgi:hypothetical protein